MGESPKISAPFRFSWRALLPVCLPLFLGCEPGLVETLPARPPIARTVMPVVAIAPAPFASATVTEVAMVAPAEPASPVPDGKWHPTEPLVPHDQTHVIVLMYHAFDWNTDARGVAPESLDKHLHYLEEHHITVAPMRELVAYLNGERELPKDVAVLTIDDGELTFYKYGFSVFKAHKMPFVLGLPTSAIEQWKMRKHSMSWDMIREILDSGLAEIASHGHTHEPLAKLSGDRVRMELETSRDLIAKNTGRVPSTFFYPMGSLNDLTEKEVIRAGYVLAFGAVGRGFDDKSPRYRLPRFGITRDVTPRTMAHFLGMAGIHVEPQNNW